MGLVSHENCGQWRVNEEVKQAFRITNRVDEGEITTVIFLQL